MESLTTSNESTASGNGRPEPIGSVSVIAPMFNEADSIEGIAQDLAAQDYDGPLEIVVADGGSTDGSVERLLRAAERHDLMVEMVDNPDRWVSNGLNRCIEQVTGDLVVRIDCHSRYPADYLRRCVEASEETGADNVGGILIARGRSAGERAAACAMDSPFGGVLWTRHGTDERVDTDTVPFGAFRREVFDRIGRFDESLVRNQDDELNLRLRLAGGRIVLDPAIRVYYTPRGSFAGVFRQYFEYGFWKPAVMRKHRRAASLRSLVPGLFVASLVVLAALSPLLAVARVGLAVELAVYGCRRGRARRSSPSNRRREQWRLLPRVVALFPTFHLAYGIGTLAGWAKELTRRQPTAGTA